MEIINISEVDADLISQYFTRNAAHFRPWEPNRPHDFHSVASWKVRASQLVTLQNLGQSLHLFAGADGAIVGHCALTQIVRGPFQACFMGYGVDCLWQGKGVAYQLCQHIISCGFNELGLHRIMANYMPHNNRSAKLLARLGFVIEGVAKDYLQIQGRWENHVLTSLTNRSFD